MGRRQASSLDWGVRQGPAVDGGCRVACLIAKDGLTRLLYANGRWAVRMRLVSLQALFQMPLPRRQRQVLLDVAWLLQGLQVPQSAHAGRQYDTAIRLLYV